MSPSINTMAGSPAPGWPDGETPRQWQQRILAERQSREKQPTPTAMAAPKQPTPTPKPAEAYRQQAEQIIKAFGAERGKEYVAKGLTYGEALQAECAAAKAENAELTADAGKRERKAKGFAGRVKIVKNGGVFNAFGKHTQRSDASE